jgi:long-chain acyl-CoA synthetase
VQGTTEMHIVDLNSGEILYPNPNKPDNGRGLKGEIHVRGPQIMKGYYKNAEATKKAFDKDGFLNTGDLGMITHNNCLKIMGRSKDTIVLGNGENVEPVPIENRLLQSSLVDHVMLVGQDQKFLAALVVPSLEGFEERGVKLETLEAAAASEEVQKLLQKEIKGEISADNGFKSFERVPDFRLVSKPFEVGDELTNLFKLKRNVITEKYEDLITDIYKDS